MRYSAVKAYYKLKLELAASLDRDPTEEEMDAELELDDDFVGQRARDFECFEIDEEEEKELELNVRTTVRNMNLVKARLAKGMDQADVAKGVGFGTQTYGQIETCRVHPSLERQKKIADFLGKPIDDLFPPWLEVFSNRWKDQESEKTVKLKTDSLGSGAAMTLLSDGKEDAERSVEKQIIAAKMAPFLEQLNPRERKIIDMKFGFTDGYSCTFDEIGRELNVTTERIRQVLDKAIEKLQNMPGFWNFKETLWR